LRHKETNLAIANPNPLAEAAVESIEIDAFAEKIPNLVYAGTTTYSLFKRSAHTIKVSNETAAGGVARPSFRIPFRVQGGSPLAQGTGNGDSLYRGSGSQWAAFAISPVFVYNVCEITWLSQQATDSKAKGLFEVKAQEMTNSLNVAMQGLEGLFNADGSGMLDQIPAAAVINNNTLPLGAGGPASSIVGMNIAAAFTDQENVTVYPSETSASPRGSFTISYTDVVSQTLYSNQALPAGTTNLDYLFIFNGTTSSGAAAATILGIRAWQVNSATGVIGGLSRNLFGGRLSTPTIALNAAPTPGLAQRTLTLLGRALGPNNEAIKSMLWHTDPTVGYAISNEYYNIQVPNSQAYKGGDATPDLAFKMFQAKFGGYDLHISWNALPGRLDGLVLDNWYIGELEPLELYDFGGGDVVAPVPDIGTTNGSYLTSHMFSYVTCLNLVDAAPKQGIYVTNISTPLI
jgi:hypothetical protein